MSQFCHCGSRAELDSINLKLAIVGGVQEPCVSCTLCGKPSHVKQTVETMTRGPKDAEFCAHVFGHRNGQSTTTWLTPRGKIETIEYRTYVRKNPLDERTDPLIYTCWNKMMDKVKEQLDPATPVEVKGKLRHEARGMAELIAVLMYPHMESARDVAVAAKAKLDDPYYEVPGLGEHLFDANYNADGSLRVKIAEPKSKPVAGPKKKVAPKKSERQLTAEEIDGIRSALDSGMFGREDVASMFKVSLADLDKALVDTPTKAE